MYVTDINIQVRLNVSSAAMSRCTVVPHERVSQDIFKLYTRCLAETHIKPRFDAPYLRL